MAFRQSIRCLYYILPGKPQHYHNPNVGSEVRPAKRAADGEASTFFYNVHGSSLKIHDRLILYKITVLYEAESPITPSLKQFLNYFMS